MLRFVLGDSDGGCGVRVHDRLRGLACLLAVAVTAQAGLVAGASAQSSTGTAGQKTVRVAGIVLKWVQGDREANYLRAERLIREAAAHGAQIVATPESFLDGYLVRDPEITTETFRASAEPIPGGQYYRRLQGLASELDIYLVAAISERAGSAVYNSAVLLGPDGSLVGKYRKKFLWPGEAHLYTAGSSLPTFETAFGTIGIMICFDRMRPDAIKELVDNGADLVLNPSGGSWGSQSDSIMSQRSRDGDVPIVFIHPVEFLVTGPDGSVWSSQIHGDEVDDPERADPGTVGYIDIPIRP